MLDVVELVCGHVEFPHEVTRSVGDLAMEENQKVTVRNGTVRTQNKQLISGITNGKEAECVCVCMCVCVRERERERDRD